MWEIVAVQYEAAAVYCEIPHSSQGIWDKCTQPVLFHLIIYHSHALFSNSQNMDAAQRNRFIVFARLQLLDSAEDERKVNVVPVLLQLFTELHVVEQ